ncbi:unnamed protein product [Soboliphyme baturini]|uniref:HTH_48 domain-containing protein n=1 Tax=Soboliphyme baturini TaxID=241478 RepID=A0A183J5I2_9BILA|nr:unnamed protein product [Soboliphyme baturini]
MPRKSQRKPWFQYPNQTHSLPEAEKWATNEASRCCPGPPFGLLTPEFEIFVDQLVVREVGDAGNGNSTLLLRSGNMLEAPQMSREYAVYLCKQLLGKAWTRKEKMFIAKLCSKFNITKEEYTPKHW